MGELKNCLANLQIYDLGGQRQFAELMPTALEQTKAVIFAFNLIQKASLISVKRWYKDARKLNKVFLPILVGTKYDLFEQKEDSYRAEVAKMARGYAENMHSPLVMCSSKSAMHVKQVFTIVVGSVFQIKIKSKQKHKESEEPLLEYDVIYKKKPSKTEKKKEKEKRKKKKKKKKKGRKSKKKEKDRKKKEKSSNDKSSSDSEEETDSHEEKW